MVTARGSGLCQCFHLSSHLVLLGINSSVSKLWIRLIHTLQSYLTGPNEIIYANEFCEIFYTRSIINGFFFPEGNLFLKILPGPFFRV